MASSPTEDNNAAIPATDEATRAADEADARAPHTADRPPTPEEEAAAPDKVDPSVARAFREAAETGAKVKGEGRI